MDKQDNLGRKILTVLAVLAVYFIAGKIGLSLAFINSSATAFWPPTGIAIAVLLILGVRYWPVIALGAFLVNYSTTGIIITSIPIGLGNALEAFAAAYLTKRFAGGLDAFYTWQNALKFVIFGALFATMLSATVGVTTLLFGNLTTMPAYSATWFTWWLGDLTGALIFTPAIILLYNNFKFDMHKNILEKAAVAALSILIPGVVFVGSNSVYYPISYLVWIPVGMAVFRYSQRETALAVAAISIIAVLGTLIGRGPFYMVGSPNESLLLVQTFVATISVFGIASSAAVKGEERTRNELITERNLLDMQVRYRTAAILESHGKLDMVFGASGMGFMDYDLNHDMGIRNVTHDQIYGHESLLPNWNMDVFYDHVLPADVKMVRKSYKDALKSGDLSFSCRIKWPDKSVHWIEVKGHVFYDEKRRPFRVLSTVVDITDQKSNVS
ncbi:MAG: MASE1 domain-containing protein [Candidatus Micrarchaeota archaeon]|nr:MASE1 domain-containing protein [Candidatus Micrarchaeota archaeon]